jgi:hypothetical protein
MGELLPAVGGVAFKRFGFVQSSVVTRWREIVGERLARISSPESVRFPQGKKAEGTLTVLVGGAHAPMMQHLAPEIRDRANRFFGYEAVAKVVIRQGELARPVAAPIAEPAPQAPVDLGEGLRAVADPELRAVLDSLARSVAANGAVEIKGNVR